MGIIPLLRRAMFQRSSEKEPEQRLLEPESPYEETPGKAERDLAAAILEEQHELEGHRPSGKSHWD